MTKEIKIKSTAQINTEVLLKLSEEEARALLAITLYGTKNFLEVFYKNMGRSYLEQHEKGLISLFKTIEEELPQHLRRASDARDVFNGSKIALAPETIKP